MDAELEEITGAVVMGLTHFSTNHPQGGVGLHIAALALGATRFDGYGIAFPGSEEKILFDSMLACVEIVIAAAGGVELGMSAAFDDSPLLHHHDLIGAADGGQAVRNDERGASLHEISESL